MCAAEPMDTSEWERGADEQTSMFIPRGCSHLPPGVLHNVFHTARRKTRSFTSIPPPQARHYLCHQPPGGIITFWQANHHLGLMA